MNEKTFEIMADTLERNITGDITYIYSIFALNNEKNILTTMKSGILPRDENFIDLTRGHNQKQLDKMSFKTPYDVLMAKLKDRVVDFYSNINFSEQVLHQLDKYGGRADIYKEQFQKDVKISMNTTIKAVTHEMDLQIMQGKDVKSVLLTMQKTLKTGTRALQRLLESSYGQMRRYMVLWEYQDRGYMQYRFVTTDENCEDCGALSGETFLISEARAGENLAPLHPNCDCGVEILDETGNVVHTIGDETLSPETDEQDEPHWYDAFLRIPEDAKQLFLNLLESQTERYKNIDDPISFLDYLMFGYLSANRHRGQVMLDDPDLYNVGNWLTGGSFDVVKGAFMPQEPLSLEHWIDSFGAATMAVSAYNMAKGNATGTLKASSPGGKRAELGSVDDANTLKKEIAKQSGEAAEVGDFVKGAGKVKATSPYNLNPNHSKTLNNNEFNALVEDIKANGIKETIKYVEHNGEMYVVDGHHRLLAAKKLGITEVPIEEVTLPYKSYKTIEDLFWWD